MSFGDNLQFLRKRQEMTQEALAEKLDVSRQSVSKWESDAAYPEMATILQLCDMFRVDLDTLLRGDVQAALAEDVAGYDRFMTTLAFRVAGAVAGILAGVALLCALLALGYSEMLCTAALMVVIAAAVVVLVASGIQHGAFTRRWPVLTDFYTQAEKDAFHPRFVWLISGGVGGIILDVALLYLFFARFPEREPYESAAVALFLLILAGAVFVLILGGMLEGRYNIDAYNRQRQRELHPTPAQKRLDNLTSALWGGGMVAVTALYIGIGQAMGQWKFAAVIYPVAALLLAVVTIFLRRNEEE